MTSPMRFSRWALLFLRAELVPTKYNNKAPKIALAIKVLSFRLRTDEGSRSNPVVFTRGTCSDEVQQQSPKDRFSDQGLSFRLRTDEGS